MSAEPDVIVYEAAAGSWLSFTDKLVGYPERFVGLRNYAYLLEDDTFHAMDGICSHEKVHLCDGLVMEGTVECPKHNATFDYRTGEAKRAPACVNLKTFPVRVQDGQVYIEI